MLVSGLHFQVHRSHTLQNIFGVELLEEALRGLVCELLHALLPCDKVHLGHIAILGKLRCVNELDDRLIGGGWRRRIREAGKAHALDVLRHGLAVKQVLCHERLRSFAQGRRELPHLLHRNILGAVEGPVAHILQLPETASERILQRAHVLVKVQKPVHVRRASRRCIGETRRRRFGLGLARFLFRRRPTPAQALPCGGRRQRFHKPVQLSLCCDQTLGQGPPLLRQGAAHKRRRRRDQRHR
mmetsp:Transcript_65032/g.188561  ORF Transcript_65032/g.188561 Transcript_65032/m.188561 type:complete len:242 (-) Transcript_65032:2072-2797(-)